MIILLTGKAGSGKDTVADILYELYAYKKVFFADTLKRAVKEIFGLTDFQAYDREEREKVIPYWGYSPRQMYQLIGTEVFRNHFDKDIWIKSLRYKLLQDINSNWVVSDCRFPNELKAFDGIGSQGRTAISVKVTRDGCDGNVGMANHESEKYDLPCDFTIMNNGTIEQLKWKVMFLMRERILTTDNFTETERLI